MIKLSKPNGLMCCTSHFFLEGYDNEARTCIQYPITITILRTQPLSSNCLRIHIDYNNGLFLYNARCSSAVICRLFMWHLVLKLRYRIQECGQQFLLSSLTVFLPKRILAKPSNATHLYFQCNASK